MDVQSQESLITEKEAAKLLSQSVQTLRNHRFNKKGIPYVKIGGSVRYSRLDIKKYIELNKINVGLNNK